MRSARALRAAPLPLGRYRLAEGLRWDGDANELLFVDIDTRRLCRYRPSGGGISTVTLETTPSAVAPLVGGGLIVAAGRGVGLLDERGHAYAHLRDLPQLDLERERLNDGRCDARGRLWVGTMALDLRSPIAKLYRVDPQGSTEIVLDGLTISNGLGWSPENDCFFHIDTPTGRVMRHDFDLETGRISSAVEFVRLERRLGVPDGLALDSDGGVWIGLWGGGEVRRYSSDGELTDVVGVPHAANVTAPCLGGPALDQLYIGTAGGMGKVSAHRWSGRLFRLTLDGITGLPECPFGLRFSGADA